MQDSFYSEEELRFIPFKSIGRDVRISRRCSLFTPEDISIGDHVRIDDFCILSGKITLGSFIHISAYTGLYGKFGILAGDYTTISARVLIYSQNDDYSGQYMTNPMIPEELTNVTGGPVIIERFAIIGAGSIVLPNITLQEGSVIGAMSFVTRDTEPWSISAGIPAVFKSDRQRNILNLVKKLEQK